MYYECLALSRAFKQRYPFCPYINVAIVAYREPHIRFVNIVYSIHRNAKTATKFIPSCHMGD